MTKAGPPDELEDQGKGGYAINEGSLLFDLPAAEQVVLFAQWRIVTTPVMFSSENPREK